MRRVMAVLGLMAIGLWGCVQPAGGTPAASSPAASSTPGPGGSVVLTGKALAGPVCPVVRDPPDPSCADRPVAGAVIVVRDASGVEKARLTTAADGTFGVRLAPGTYDLEPQPVEGLLGTAKPQQVVLTGAGVTDLIVEYDTGIR